MWTDSPMTWLSWDLAYNKCEMTGESEPHFRVSLQIINCSTAFETSQSHPEVIADKITVYLNCDLTWLDSEIVVTQNELRHSKVLTWSLHRWLSQMSEFTRNLMQRDCGEVESVCRYHTLYHIEWIDTLISPKSMQNSTTKLRTYFLGKPGRRRKRSQLKSPLIFPWPLYLV